MSEILEMQINNKKIVIGVISESIFSKAVSKKKHLYRNLNAWGIDAIMFDGVILKKCKDIVIFDKDENVQYRVSSKKWKQHGIYLQHNPYRSQTFLPLEFFNKVSV